MITKAQSKQYAKRPPVAPELQLTALEKGMLRWTMAERGDKVLDAYVGGGLLLEYLQRNMECEICGMSDKMEHVRQARSRLHNADIIYSSLEDIPWKESTFDSIYLKMDRQRLTSTMLQEILRVLKPGGQLLMGFKTVPGPLRIFSTSLRTVPDEEMLKARERTRALQLMQACGLMQITWQPTGLLHSVGIGWKPLEPDANQI